MRSQPQFPLPNPLPPAHSCAHSQIKWKRNGSQACAPRLATSCKWHSCNLCSAYTLGSSSFDFGIFWSQKFQWIHSSSIHFAAIDSLHLKSLPFSVSLVGSSVLRGLGRWGRELMGYRVLNCMRKVAGKVTKVFLQFYRQTVLLFFITFFVWELQSSLFALLLLAFHPARKYRLHFFPNISFTALTPSILAGSGLPQL